MAMGVVVVSLKMPTTPFSNVLLPNSSRVVSVIASIELESRIDLVSHLVDDVMPILSQ